MGTFESHALNKIISKRIPFYFRIGNVVGIHITCCPTEFCGDRYGFKESYLLLDSCYVNVYLLAESCRRGRLPMCMCKHRYIFPLLCVSLQNLNNLKQ